MFKNDGNIPIILAAWLCSDTYDYEAGVISATSLIKPIKQIILGNREGAKIQDKDIAELVPSSFGTAIHSAIENVWLGDYRTPLRKLGYSHNFIDNILINPKAEELGETSFSVYLELRSYKEILGYKVSGKFDQIVNGTIEDNKSTSVWAYINKSNDDKYRLQLSIYRWLNPKLVTNDTGSINYIFTDWSASKVKTTKGYPICRVLSYPLKLMSLKATESYVRDKLEALKRYEGKEESELPECTGEDLWRRASVFKYYRNPEKMTRSTGNFDNAYEANLKLADNGGKGIVIEKKGEVVACRYCSAFPICKQKNEYLLDGTLNI